MFQLYEFSRRELSIARTHPAMMMRLVAFFALVAVALAQDDDGSYSADKYENPYAYSEQQQGAPAAPQYQPQYQPQQYQPQPQYQPQQYQPQQYQPQPQYQPQARQYQPQPQQYQPQPQQYQPQQYQPQYQQPRAPQYQPQVPQYQPQQYQAPAASVNGLPQTSTNYKTQGHERAEAVDGQGNVRGQYSYVDPDGKTITVKYTAGKDGFQVEGDHLPRAPVPGAPAPAAPAGPPAYQPRYVQPAAAPAYQPRYQPAAAAAAYPQGAPSAADQYLSSPLGHRFAAGSF